MHRHRRGVGLALERVARDVGRGQGRTLQQRAVDPRLVLPDVERERVAAREQCGAVDHLAARGVEHDAAGAHAREERGVARTACRRVERRVERQDVGLVRQRAERQEAAVLAAFARRVAAEHAESPCLGVVLHERADVAHSDDAQRALPRGPALRAGQAGQRRADPLQHAAGVASGGRRHADAVRTAVAEVDVVEADGGRGDHPYGRAFEQGGVAPGAGADDERVGVAHVGGRDAAAGQVDDLGVGLEYAPQKGNGVVCDDFHDSSVFRLRNRAETGFERCRRRAAISESEQNRRVSEA